MKTFERFINSVDDNSHASDLCESTPEITGASFAAPVFRKIQELHRQVSTDRHASEAERCLSSEILGNSALLLILLGITTGNGRFIQIARSRSS